TLGAGVASTGVAARPGPRGGPAMVGPPDSPATSGRANASVLPEPVRPRPRMSRPAKASGSVAAWIGNGVVIPALASAATSGAGTPREAKVAAGAGGLGVPCRGRAARTGSLSKAGKEISSVLGWPHRRPPQVRGNQLAHRRGTTGVP